MSTNDKRERPDDESSAVATELLVEAALDPAEEPAILKEAVAEGIATAKKDGGDPLPTRWVVFAVVSATLMMGSLDATIVATALHTIQKSLHAQLNWSAWTISAYSLGRIISLPMMGKIGDKYGRRRIFIGATILFGVASLACGLATNIYMLDVLRLFQAIGGGAFIPSATAIVAEQFGRERDRAVALFSSIVPIGGIIGPIFGGLFVAYWSWRGIFFVNIPICVVVIFFALKYVPESRPGATKPNDFRGIALFSSFLLLFTYAITELGNGNVGLLSPAFYAPELVSFVLAYFFWKHIHVFSYPLIPVRFLFGKGFGPINIVNIVFGAGTLGFGALVPLYAQDRFHVDVLSSGTLLTARGIGAISLAGLTAVLLRKIGTRIPMMLGFTITAAGILLAIHPPHGFPIVGWLALSAGIAGLGMGMTTPATGNAGMHLAPEDSGTIGGLRAMFRLVGNILGVAIASAVITRSVHPGITEADCFFVFALICFATVPFLFLVPDGRGRW